MAVGTIGSILVSLYIKKTSNYSLALRVTSIGASIFIILFIVWVNTGRVKIITTLILSMLGFSLTPLVPICYDLGCELSFPIGEAQVTGMLNGGALLWTFVASLFATSAIGFGTEHQSLIIVSLFITFIVIGSILFFTVKIDLKRRNMENGNNSISSALKEPKNGQ
jgi:hypothetical protein